MDNGWKCADRVKKDLKIQEFKDSRIQEFNKLKIQFNKLKIRIEVQNSKSKIRS
ncbi:MAG: hypothetical protein FD170_452 [Bacteroidetes bacterium]|nr:MAG: hypothetical protein FD170_452 [Bacteroidota bacterium]